MSNLIQLNVNCYTKQITKAVLLVSGFQDKVKMAPLIEQKLHPGLTHVKISVWPKVGLQALFTAGRAWRTPQPIQIKSFKINWVERWTSHEPLELAELGSALRHVKYGVWPGPWLNHPCIMCSHWKQWNPGFLNQARTKNCFPSLAKQFVFCSWFPDPIFVSLDGFENSGFYWPGPLWGGGGGGE